MPEPARRPARSRRIRSRLVIVIALCALAAPGAASAHSGSNVIALDYEARLPAHGVVAPGVRARVIDGDRKLELSVSPARTVVVVGYGGEPFLRFSASGVKVNDRSPTAVADRLAREGVVPALIAGARPSWRTISRGHRLAWHDHRLGPPSRSGNRTGRVGEWQVPLLVDGTRARVEGELWQASDPPLAPWLALWAVPLVGAAAAAKAKPGLRCLVLFAAAGLCGALAIADGASFTLASPHPALTETASLGVPALVIVAAVVVFALQPARRVAAATLAGGFAFAWVLADASVFRHGFVFSALPDALTRALVASGIAAGAAALVVGLAELLRGEREAQPRASRPQLAVPRGKR